MIKYIYCLIFQLKRIREKYSNRISYLYYSLLVIVATTIFAEAFLYRGALASNIGVSADIVLWVAIALLSLIRIIFDVSTGRIFSIYLLILMPLLIAFSILGQGFDSLFYENFSYGMLHISPTSLYSLLHFVILISLVLFDYRVLKKYWRQTIFVSAIFGFSLFVYLKWSLPDIFYELDHEDSITEYLTAITYLAAGIFSLKTFIKVKNSAKNRYRYIWLLMLTLSTIGLFFIVGEELSWGQRILNIQTPEALESVNNQKELNIHNIGSIFGYVYDAYLILGYWGLLSWIISYLPIKISGFKLSDVFKPVVSRWYLTSYFVPIIAYVLWRYHSVDGAFDVWEETIELFPAVGMLFIFLLNYSGLRKDKASFDSSKGA